MTRKQHRETRAALPGRPPTFFVWRETCSFAYEADYLSLNEKDLATAAAAKVKVAYQEFEPRCPFCSSEYREVTPWFAWACPVCGFHYEFDETSYCADEERNDWVTNTVYTLAALRKLDVNSADLTMAELGSHLKRRYRDVYHLHWRVFERLIEDIYKTLGYRTRLTSKSRDGGYDIILLGHRPSAQIIVECKRYRKERKVGIEIVDRLLGVQLRLRRRKAKLVTTSTFTSPAQEAARQARRREPGYELELVDASRLARALDVYDVRLPPLHVAVAENPSQMHPSSGAANKAVEHYAAKRGEVHRRR